MAESGKTILAEEVIYGALRREKVWKWCFCAMALAATASVGAAAAVVVAYIPPAPMIIPFDPKTGMAVPNARVESVTLDERAAVIQAMVYQYVKDRETYNQLDNDIRINRALARTTGTARKAFVRLWDSSSEDFLPERYGNRTQVDVVINAITPLDENRVQIRMRKQLISPDGTSVGNFTAVAAVNFDPSVEKTLEAVWQNPLGFTVSEYALYQDRRE